MASVPIDLQRDIERYLERNADDAEAVLKSLSTGHVWLGQQSDAPTDSEIGSGNVALYAKDDGNLYKKPYGGSESQIGGSGSSIFADGDGDGIYEQSTGSGISSKHVYNASDLDTSRLATGSTITPNVVENQSLSGSTTTTVLNYSGTGVLRDWWTAMSGGAEIGDATFEIIVDGNTTDSIEGSFNTTFQRLRVDDSNVDPHEWSWDIGHVGGMQKYDSSQYSKAWTGANFQYPIPFDSSIEIRLTNHRSSSFTYYSLPLVEPLKSEEVPNLRLRSSSQHIAPDGFLSVSPGSSFNFFDIPSGTTGYIAGLYWASSNSNGDRINIEDNINAHIDRESTPSRKSSGSEDFLYFSWGDVWDSFREFNHSLIGYNYIDTSPYEAAWGADFLAAEGGIRFSDGCYVQLNHESSSPSSDEYAWSGYWYEEI